MPATKAGTSHNNAAKKLSFHSGLSKPVVTPTNLFAATHTKTITANFTYDTKQPPWFKVFIQVQDQ